MNMGGHEKEDNQLNGPHNLDISLSKQNMLNQWAQLSRGFGSSHNFLMMPPVMRRVGKQENRDRVQKERAQAAQAILGDYLRFTKRSPDVLRRLAVQKRLNLYLAILQGRELNQM